MDSNNNVIINLDRPRELRFGHSALKNMLASMNISLENFEVDGSNLEQVEQIYYFGLLSDARKNGETLKLEDMEGLLDQADSFGEVIEKMTLAINKAFKSTSENSKNLKQVATKVKKTS